MNKILQEITGPKIVAFVQGEGYAAHIVSISGLIVVRPVEFGGHGNE